MPKRSPVEHVMPPAVEDEWLMLAVSGSQPYPDASIDFLINSIAEREFMFVGTILWEGHPASLIFRFQRTVTAAGQRIRQQIAEKPALIAARWLRRPIDLEPFTDRPSISHRGEKPCTHAEALAIAHNFLQFSTCSILYAINRETTGRA